MILIKDTSIRIQVSKEIIQELLDLKRFHLELLATKHWKKELLDVKLVDDELQYNLREIKTITVSNGLHPELPVYEYECIRFSLSDDEKKFVFQLGKRLNQEEVQQEKFKPKQLNIFD